MNPRKDAIEAMRKFHEDFKHGEEDSKEIEEKLQKLDESDRNFMLLNSKMKKFEDLYPTQNTLSDKYSLADLVMAYHLYCEELDSTKDDEPLMITIDKFYA